MEIVTCKAPVNIATIKYWGKRDETLILPLNDSVSVTLNCSLMFAKTTIAASPNFENNKIWLNGKEESFSNSRLLSCINEIRELAKKSSDPKVKAMADWKLHICSENNFPTAAGLASSAAGYACLVFSLAQLFKIEGDLSKIARRGSGSACRSIHGGFVVWRMGKEKDGSDSLAEQIAPASHWKQLKILVLIVNASQKEVGSSISMQRSVKTSDFLMNFSLSDRVVSMIEAIEKKDFPLFAKITMKDSNRLHAICLDTYPPVQYLNDTSYYIIHLVHMINEYFGFILVAYSFDAGPNACLFVLEEHIPLILSLINHYLPCDEKNGDVSYFKGENINLQPISSDILNAISIEPRPPGSLKGIIYTDVGGGPEVMSKEDHLLNAQGFPRRFETKYV